MTPIFLDTVGLLALWDEADQWHPAAEQAYQQLTTAGARWITSSFVLLECANAAARKPYRQDVAELREMLEASGQLIHPSLEDWQLAWQAYRRGHVGDAGIVDHVSFQIMRRYHLTKAFTNDRHFAAAGFETAF